MSPLVRQKRLTLKDRAPRHLREALLSGDLLPGERPGMSRFPRAIARLVREGRVEPYCGAYMAVPERREIEEAMPSANGSKPMRWRRPSCTAAGKPSNASDRICNA